MTPAERARLIDRQEFEAECRAARQRAMRHAEALRRQMDARIAAWLGKELSNPARVRAKSGPKPKLYTYNGQSKTLTEWAEVAGVPYRTFSQRIRSGMEFERAVTMEEGSRANLHTINGVSKTLQQWADHVGISYMALIARMRKGRTLAEALAVPAGRGRGVVSNFAPSKGTSAGSTAQETPEISFSEKAEA